MRWESLFADLESQADAVEADHWRRDVAARTRSARADVTLGGRLLASHGSRVLVVCTDGEPVSGVLREGGEQWLLIAADDGREHVIPLQGVDLVQGLANHIAQPGIVDQRLSFARALRELSRDRARVRIVTRTAVRTGVLAMVGRDSCDLVAEADAVVTVPLAAIVRCSSVM